MRFKIETALLESTSLLSLSPYEIVINVIPAELLALKTAATEKVLSLLV